MNATRTRPMSFEVRPIEGAAPDERWRWLVYNGPDGLVVRDGQVAGDRNKAERAARAAIANMGGIVMEPVSTSGEQVAW